MGEESDPLWRLVASRRRRPMDSTLHRHISTALAGAAVRMQRDLLERLGLQIDTTPMLWKYMPGPYLRLFFRVEGESLAIEEGRVVALVLLHDPQRGRTLYAHPIHAGPQANPLLKHLHGPMAAPKAQEGANGDRATLRLLEHKQAIWDRFLLDRERLEPREAGQLRRERYFWALMRVSTAKNESSAGSTGAGSPILTQISAPMTPAGFAFEVGVDSSMKAMVC